MGIKYYSVRIIYSRSAVDTNRKRDKDRDIGIGKGTGIDRGTGTDRETRIDTWKERKRNT